MRLLGLIVIGVIVGATAQAFQIDSRRDAASDHGQSDALTGQPPSDYRYSGDNFNFSMSRNKTPPNGTAANADAAEKAAPKKAQPGFFRRIFNSIFGDD
jgi:hypothetical protein